MQELRTVRPARQDSLRKHPGTWIAALTLPALLALWAGCAGEFPEQRSGDGAPDRHIFILDDAGSSMPDAGAIPGDTGASPTAPEARPPNPTPDTGSPGPSGPVDPPLGGSSQGSGGTASPGGKTVSAGGVSYILIVPTSYSPSAPSRMMVIFSGTEGASQMASNMVNLAPMYSLKDVIFAVLDGPSTVNNGQAGATVLDDVRARYNIDNDRTFLIGESAGTGAALQLGLKLRQSYFAAYWANDVVAAATPAKNATALGFAPWGNAGPGGQAAKAQSIVDGMRAAGYRLPADAPYSGAGAGSHGSPQQFMAALSFFGGKSRK